MPTHPAAATALPTHPPLLQADKIAQLNAAIDDVSSQLNSRDAVKDEAKA